MCDDGTRPCGTDEGECVAGVETCSAGAWGPCVGEVGSDPELCDTLDNDCDGDVDEGCSCTDGTQQPCGTDEGACAAGMQDCIGGAWGPCNGEIGPGVESCNGLDDDCDAVLDDGLDPIPAANVLGACAANVSVCAGAVGYEDAAANHVPVPESCNDADDDCNGATDEGCDDDLDGFCDGGMALVGTPAICGGGGLDCDDLDAGVRPGGTDVCDGLDNDCGGSADDGCDDDLDGFCDAGLTVVDPAAACPGSAVGPGDDCDDTAAAVNPGTLELCDGRDDDCDGGTDEGCDDDLDGFCDSLMTVAGAPAICPGSPAGPGNDCDDTTAATNPAALELCNGADDDCGAGTDEGCDDDLDGYCDSSMTVVGAPASCPSSPAGPGDDCDDAAFAVHPGAAELCDGVDNACSGIDPGCDDDGDGHCDAAMIVVGSPAVCPGSPAGTADDCDDASAAVNPGAVELCTDGIDNDCDGAVDLADPVACPAIAVDINAFADPRDVNHGQASSVFAMITPADGPPLAWARVWTVISAIDPAGLAVCTAADVILSGQADASGSSSVNAALPNDAGKLGCVYTLEVRVNGYATDTIGLRLVNHLPAVTIQNAIFDGTSWRLRAVPGSTPSLVAVATDADGDSPLFFDWSGADAGLLSCSPNCSTSDGTAPRQATVTFGAPITPGSYALTVAVRDGFEPVAATAQLVLEVDTCVWVGLGGTGNGLYPVDPAPAPPNEGAMGTIQAALDQAKLSPGTAVCVLGDAAAAPNAIFPENLTIPSTPNAPDLVGGFDLAGNPNGNRPAVELSRDAGVTFERGYAGTVARLLFRQRGAYVPAGAAAVITVADASPELLAISVNATKGVGTAMGIHVFDDATFPDASAPTILSSQLSANVVALANASALHVDEAAGSSASVTLRGSSVSANGCTTECRGVYLGPGTAGSILGNQQINASATGEADGIFVQGAAGAATSAVIDGNDSIGASAFNGQRAIAIRLELTQGVSITNNRTIGMWGQSGRQLGAGIADGYVLRDGTLVRGDSDLLTISGNDTIGGLMSFANRCVNPGDTGEAADVVTGVLLVGTTNATISDNGRTGDSTGGIFGGSSSVHWSAGSRRLPPSAVGLWLIATTSATVEANELRGGSYAVMPTCPVPLENPASIAYRDGLPPNPNFLPAPVAGSMPSLSTLVDRNAISCARPPENGAFGSPLLTWCSAIEVNEPDPAARPLRILNNYIAGTRGNFIIAYRQRGGGGVELYNNTLDADLMLRPWDPPPMPASIRKWPVLLEGIAPAGVRLVNNVIYAHRQDPYDLVSERLCYREVVAAGTSSRADLLQNNLFYVEGDDLSSPAAPYIRVTNGLATSDYLSDQLNSVVGIGADTGNFAALPGLLEYGEDWQKGSSRLLPGSAAIDQGLPAGGGVPDHDIDGEARPAGAGVDVGHDEAP